MSDINRRQFVGAAAAGAMALASIAEAQSVKTRKVTDRVPLGKTGLKVSLLGIGTGTVGWNHASNQTRLGQEKFTEIVRHAYDRGVCLFDGADQYGSYPFYKEALKGLPREKLVILGKSNSRTPDAMRADLDRFRKELGTDYIDVLLIHCVTEGDWNVRYRGIMDVLEEARQKKIIRAHGVSCHSYDALAAAAAEPWVQVDLARFNPWGMMMDNKPGEPREKTPELVKGVLSTMKKAGKGVVAMKIMAEGQMGRGPDRLDRARESVKFVLGSGVVDTMVIGFQSPRELDELLDQTKAALAELDHGVA